MVAFAPVPTALLMTMRCWRLKTQLFALKANWYQNLHRYHAKFNETFGVEITNHHTNNSVEGRSTVIPPSLSVEGDAFVSVLFSPPAIKAARQSDRNWPQKRMQGDIRFADVLRKWAPPPGDDFIACTRGELHAIDMDMNHNSGCGDDDCHYGAVCERNSRRCAIFITGE